MRKIAIVWVMLAVSCSGGEKSKTDETTEKEVVEQPVEPPDEAEEKAEEPPDQGDGIAWADKSPEQQKAFMKLTVKPKMTEVFQAFDPEEFAEVKCSTCHGAKEYEFEMPNPDLPRLDFKKWEAEEPEMMEFMKEKVVPEMAALLGQEPYNPETKEGFGCGACHPPK